MGRMGRPRAPAAAVERALLAYAKGATAKEAGAQAGIAASTVLLYVHEEAVVVLRERRRPGALSLEDREEIRVGIEREECDATIARRLGRHRGAIGREIRANDGRAAYRAYRAQARADEAARRPKVLWTEARPWLWDELQDLLRVRCRPEQIAKRLRRDHPNEPQWWVSHESIYQAIYVQAKGELRKELAACLKSGRARRRPWGRHGHNPNATARIAGMVNISERPAEVEDRAVPGHWEGDLITGAHHLSVVATVVERTTRTGMLIKLEDKSAEHVAAHRRTRHAAPGRAGPLPHLGPRLRDGRPRQLQCGHGHPGLLLRPRQPLAAREQRELERPRREFLPKGTDLSRYSQEELDDIARLLNTRPT